VTSASPERYLVGNIIDCHQSIIEKLGL
jgi:hypothetical protein